VNLISCGQLITPGILLRRWEACVAPNPEWDLSTIPNVDSLIDGPHCLVCEQPHVLFVSAAFLDAEERRERDGR
jgi:hypothetical protein